MPMSKTHTPKKASSSDWHNADIKAALEKAGWSLARLSIHCGYSRSAMKAALANPYPAAEKFIADAIGLQPQEIWPSRYNADGTSIRPPGRPIREVSLLKDTSSSQRCNVDKERADEQSS